MKIGVIVNYAEGFAETVDELVALEDVGLQLVAVPEAYSFDGVSQLGFTTARTRTLSSSRRFSRSTRALRRSRR